MAVHFDYSKESFWKQLLPKDFQGTKAQSVQVNKYSFKCVCISVSIASNLC